MPCLVVCLARSVIGFQDNLLCAKFNNAFNHYQWPSSKENKIKIISIRIDITRIRYKKIAKQLLFINRIPKLCAILQLISAPLNPVPIEEHFTWSHPLSEHSN